MDRQLAEMNRQLIDRYLQEYPEGKLLAAWGSVIRVRPYLSRELKLISEITTKHQRDWLQIGTPTKSGHPRHPSRAAYAQGLREFDIEGYMERLEASPSTALRHFDRLGTGDRGRTGAIQRNCIKYPNTYSAGY